MTRLVLPNDSGSVRPTIAAKAIVPRFGGRLECAGRFDIRRRLAAQDPARDRTAFRARPAADALQPNQKKVSGVTGDGRFGDAFRAELLDLLVWRRDVRRFRRDPLPDGTLERLVRIACLAPSVGLSQPWRFVSVVSAARRSLVRATFERCNADALRSQSGEKARLYAKLKLAGIDEAPCHFALYADPTTERGHGLGRLTMPSTIDYSAVMAVHTLWLAARAEGIGLGWVSILDPEAVAVALDVPRAWTFIGYFCMGYPVADDDAPALERQGWEARCDPGSVLLAR